MKPQNFCDCKQAFEHLSDFLDHELSAEEIEHVKQHLEICEECAIEYKFETKLIIELKAKARCAPAPQSLRESVLRALDQVEFE